MKINTLAWLCLMALPFSLSSLAESHKAPAKAQGQKQEQHKLQHQQHKMNSKQAAAIAQQQHPGKVLSVKRENNHFKVKMLHEGNVRYVTVPQ